MGKWSDLAGWCGPTVNQDGKMVEQRGVVLHIAEGSYEGTISWQKNASAEVSSHFIAAKDGRACQMVDTATTAWTQKAGNGHWLSIENEGNVPDKLTDHQIEFAAQILARAHKEYGVPLQIATSPDGKGLGHHSMGANPGSPNDWGHSSCPGTNIINQKSAIVARAKEIVGGDDMSFDDVDRKYLRATAERIEHMTATWDEKIKTEWDSANPNAEQPMSLVKHTNEINGKLDQILAGDNSIIVGPELLKQVMLDPQVVETYAKAIGDQIVGLRYERTN